jgi:dihydroxyacid dehydratase/phosphogluconate dehydratase
MSKDPHSLRILKGRNPYSYERGEAAMQPLTVIKLLREADVDKNVSENEVRDRLDSNAPRIAIIHGSPDHPAHVDDRRLVLIAASVLWELGAVPFVFGLPALCSRTARGHLGTSYSCAARNLLSAMVVNQMETQNYHGAFVLQGCGKFPFGVLNGLSSLDVSRKKRGDAPVFASFMPSYAEETAAGTAYECRIALSALGLVHPDLEKLSTAPAPEQLKTALSDLTAFCNDPDFSVSTIVLQNIGNAIKLAEYLGVSTGFWMELTAALVYAGKRFSAKKYCKFLRNNEIPQAVAGPDTIDTELLLLDLIKEGVGINGSSLTVNGATWQNRFYHRERDERRAPAVRKKDRSTAGIECVKSNFFSTAVMNVEDLGGQGLEYYDGKTAVTLYFENEDDFDSYMRKNDIVASLKDEEWMTDRLLRSIYRENSQSAEDPIDFITDLGELLQIMIDEEVLRIAVVIGGQGPLSYGIPELELPLSAWEGNAILAKNALFITDGIIPGRPAPLKISHLSPEAWKGGRINYLRSGDLLHLDLSKRRLLLLDTRKFFQGSISKYSGKLKKERKSLGKERKQRMKENKLRLDETNVLYKCTNAVKGAVPKTIWKAAGKNVSIKDL